MMRPTSLMFRSILSTLNTIPLLTLLLANSASAQFVPTPSNFTTLVGSNVTLRYKEVPTGICELDAHVRSFAGYADVAADQHLFWWFFEAREIDPTTAPLTIWINGGPGTSSMVGLFQENGPCNISLDGTIGFNNFSWTNHSNVLYIDQPNSVGFSYSYAKHGYQEPQGSIINLPNATCPDYVTPEVGVCGTYSAWNISTTPNNTDNAAPFFYQAVQGFLGAFPQYSKGGVNFATESYGGRYGPIYSRYILEQNALGKPHIDLQNLLIGNGCYSGLSEYSVYYNWTVAGGNPYWGEDIYNASTKARVYNALYGEGNCYDQLQQCLSTANANLCGQAHTFCTNNVESVFDQVTNRPEEETRLLNEADGGQTYPNSTSYVNYLNTPAAQQALGAYVNFSQSSTLYEAAGTTFWTFDDAYGADVESAIAYVLAHNVSVTLYNGDADYECNAWGAYGTALALNRSDWNAAGFANVSVAGLHTTQALVKQAGLFAFARIFNSGHEVPFYQPELIVTLFERAINRQTLSNGNASVTDDYATTGPANGLLIYPEGLSTVQNTSLPWNTTYVPITNQTQNNFGPQVPARHRRRSRRAMLRELLKVGL